MILSEGSLDGPTSEFLIGLGIRWTPVFFRLVLE